MKYSKQKEIILKAVMEQKCHPTANDIYTYLRNENPNISLGTVYRNLNRFAEKGMIYKICIANASDRFDSTISEHYHMICDKCGNVEDIEFSGFDKLEKEILEKNGFEVQSRSLVLYGLCKNCRDI